MAVPHPPPLPANAHPSPSPSNPHQHPQYPFPMQGQPGQPIPVQTAQAYPQSYGAVRPPPPQAGVNAVAMSSQQAAQLQASQRQMQLAQQQQMAQQQAQQQRGVIPPSPRHPSPSPHMTHQGFPVNGPGAIHPQQYPHPPQPPGPQQQGSGPSPAQMRQASPHPQQSRPPQQPGYPVHPGMQAQQQQPPQPMARPQPQQMQPQPGLNGMAGGPQHMQQSVEQQDAYTMARVSSRVQPMQRQDSDGLLRLYILDYLIKNNFPAAAAQFNAEAGLGDQRAPINVQDGLLHEWWCVFWDVFSGGKGSQGPTSAAVYTDTMNRLKSIRQQQLGVPAHVMQPQGGQYPGGQPQPISSQQMLNFRQLQQAQAQAQVNGLTQAQAQLMQQQMQQQQHVQQQQAAAQHALLQQQQAAQRYAQQPGRSASPVPRPPQPGHPMYQQHQQMQLQPPNAQAGPSHSPVSVSPHLMQQPHPSVMPSPRQKGMRPPSVNGAPANPMMRAMTPQQAAMAQQGQQYAPQGVPSSAANGPPPPMTPQQQQMMQAQAQAMQQRAQQALAEAQAQQQHQQGQQGQQQHGLTNHQLQQLQQQQMQAAANQMYSSLGLGQVNPTVMHHTAQSLGLGGRDVQAMSEEDRQRLIQQYRISMQESQRRAMLAANGTAPPNAAQQRMLVQQQQQIMQQAAAEAQAHARSQAMAEQQEQQRAQGMQMQLPNGTQQGYEQGPPMQQTDSANGGGLGNSPPDRKRMRRNSDSAAPSPYTPIQQPMQYQPGLQTPQQQQQALHQQHIQTQMAQADAQAQNDPQMQAMRRQQEMEARMVYEKKMHQDQAMRSMQLGQQPHTPNMSALDASSPLQQGSVSGASPRNAMSARHMQRESSKGGSMLPPQSPATTTQRTSTPKPVSSSKTPKMMKEDLAREGVPPKSLVPSPNNGLIPMGVDSNDSSSTHNLTPSPPTPNDQTNAIQAPASVPSLSAGSNSLSFATNTDLATDGGFNLEASSGEFDFASLGGLGEVNFDFGLYLAELDGEGGDGEIGVVP